MANVLQTPYLRRYAELLPPETDIRPQGADYWQEMGVWHDRVVAKLGDRETVARDLTRLGRNFLDAMLLRESLAREPSCGRRAADTLAAHIVRNPHQHWAQNLFLAMATVHNRRYDAIDAAAEMILAQEKRSVVDGCHFTPRGRRLSAALLAYYQSPADLTRMMLFERSERYSYSRHFLVGPAMGSTAVRGGGDATPDPLSPAVINRALAVCEADANGGKRSICLDTLPGADGSTTVFLRQVLREASIPEMDRTLFGDQVETIVLRFSGDLSVLEQHSARQTGVTLANAIVSHLTRTDVVYRDDQSASNPRAVARFLRRLDRGEDDRLELVEIFLEQAPADGSPHMMVRGEQGMPIGSALNHLRRKGLNLFAAVEDIRHLGVTFSPGKRALTRRYIFKLKVADRKQSCVIHYFGAHHSIGLRREFEAYLKETYDVTAIPATR